MAISVGILVGEAADRIMDNLAERTRSLVLSGPSPVTGDEERVTVFARQIAAEIRAAAKAQPFDRLILEASKQAASDPHDGRRTKPGRRTKRPSRRRSTKRRTSLVPLGSRIRRRLGAITIAACGALGFGAHVRVDVRCREGRRRVVRRWPARDEEPVVGLEVISQLAPERSGLAREDAPDQPGAAGDEEDLEQFNSWLHNLRKP